jgi:hypothetical protein
MTDEMGRHAAAMADLLQRLDDGYSHMGGCLHGDRQSMSEMMSELHAADTAHREHMQAAQNLDAAAAECRDYTSTTDMDLDRMGGMMVPGMMSCM